MVHIVQFECWGEAEKLKIQYISVVGSFLVS